MFEIAVCSDLKMLIIKHLCVFLKLHDTNCYTLIIINKNETSQFNLGKVLTLSILQIMLKSSHIQHPYNVKKILSRLSNAWWFYSGTGSSSSALSAFRTYRRSWHARRHPLGNVEKARRRTWGRASFFWCSMDLICRQEAYWQRLRHRLPIMGRTKHLGNKSFTCFQCRNFLPGNWTAKSSIE